MVDTQETIPTKSFHDLRWDLDADERAAGYLCGCRDCPAVFRSAKDWLSSRCPVVP